MFGYRDETLSPVIDILHQSTKTGHQCVRNLNQVTIETTIARMEFAVTQVGLKPLSQKESE